MTGEVLRDPHDDNGTAPAYTPCPGLFILAEQLPRADVFHCSHCGQHRVRFHDPDAAHRAMAGLADALTAAAGEVTA